MRPYEILSDLLKYQTSARPGSRSWMPLRDGKHKLNLDVQIEISEYHMLRLIMACVLAGWERLDVIHYLRFTHDEYDQLLNKLKSISGMSGKSVVAIRKNQNEVWKKLHHYYRAGTKERKRRKK